MIGIALLSTAASAPLSLVCTAQMVQAIPTETTSVIASDSYGGQAYGSGVRSQLATVEAVINFRMAGGVATIRIPRWLANDLNGGNAGWYKVKKLVVTDREISGTAAIGFLNHRKFRIDRMTGVMTTSESSYQCRPEQETERKF